MAGSGKTSFMQRMNAHYHAKARAGHPQTSSTLTPPPPLLCSQGTPPYVINLDPAVTKLPYGANIDIRDTVNYKEVCRATALRFALSLFAPHANRHQVMKQYSLGPNGGILTAANLFATRFDQVIGLLKARETAGTLGVVLIDTPGQIEIFTWSASGQLISEALGASFRTVVAYVLDTPRCVTPQTFGANMLQAVSILYKMQLPMVLVFNKIDVARHEFALAWMEDFELYHQALDDAPQGGYGSDLARSLSLVLDEFYKAMRSVGVSAVSGEGADTVAAALSAAGEEYEATYAVDLAARRLRLAGEVEARKQASLDKFRKDHMAQRADGRRVVVDPNAPRRGGQEGSDEEQEEEEEEEEEDSEEEA